MSFLRRLLGDRDRAAEDEQPDVRPPADEGAPGGGSPASAGAGADDVEAARERELLREDAARLDELQQRQLRYARYAWTPPPQGGERRADDEDRGGDR